MIYYGMTIVYQEGKQPFIISTYTGYTTKEEAEIWLKDLFENYPNYKPVVTWIQEFDDNGNRKDTDVKYYVSSFGLTLQPYTIGEEEGK